MHEIKTHSDLKKYPLMNELEAKSYLVKLMGGNNSERICAKSKQRAYQ